MATLSPQATRPAKKDATSPASPLAIFRFENVSAAIFTDRVKTQGGQMIDVFRVSVRRSYKNSEGTWESTHTLHVGDLLPAALALMKCYDFVNDAKSADQKRQ